MIITCTHCKTRYHFDDTLITGEGVWLRCSRCLTTFFFGNPAASAPPSPEPVPKPDMVHEEDADATTSAGADLPAPDQEKPEEVQGEEIAGDLEDQAPTEEEPPKPKPWVSWKMLGLIVAINLALGFAIYLSFFPEAGQRIWVALTANPQIAALLGVEPTPGEVNPGLITLKDVQRRLSDNFFVGSLLVIEGRAVNTSENTLTLIQIQGKLYDADDKILRLRVSYCGNALNNTELATLPEEEIQKRLATPQSINPLKDQVQPNGEIPFMIVFALEGAGMDRKAPLIKTGVIPMAAERLLP